MRGGSDDDDLVGGSSTSTTSSSAGGIGQPDSADNVYGGSGDDLLLGDNGLLTRFQTGRDWRTQRSTPAGTALVPGRGIVLLDLNGRAPAVAITAHSDGDALSGQSGVDVILGQDGADAISGGGDDDYVEGQGSADAIRGDAPLGAGQLITEPADAAWVKPGADSAALVGVRTTSPVAGASPATATQATRSKEMATTTSWSPTTVRSPGWWWGWPSRSTPSGTGRRMSAVPRSGWPVGERPPPGSAPVGAATTCEGNGAYGDDVVRGDEGDDVLYGQDGDDTMAGSATTTSTASSATSPLRRGRGGRDPRRPWRRTQPLRDRLAVGDDLGQPAPEDHLRLAAQWLGQPRGRPAARRQRDRLRGQRSRVGDGPGRHHPWW